MIIPTPQYDPMYADDGVPFRTKMIRYIEREFADLLRGRRAQLVIDPPAGNSTSSDATLRREASRVAA